MVRSPAPILDPARIQAFAELAKKMKIPAPLNFYDLTLPDGKVVVFDDMYPPLHAPTTIEFFFFAMIHQYGFWLDKDGRYEMPLYGTWNGRSDVKGSDLLWKILMGAWKRDEYCFAPYRLAEISDADHALLFSDDNGPIPLFDTPERRQLTRSYGQWFHVARMAGKTPSDLVQFANMHDDPVMVLRTLLTDKHLGIPGYREDILGKKAELLLMALTNRPDRPLRLGPNTTWSPIIDYHVMRLALRTALVDLPTSWSQENTDRAITTPEREHAIRDATFRAVKLLISGSGRTMAEIDNLMWSARRYCPEVEEPQCGKCPLAGICDKRIDRFQPVLRTTNY